MVRRLLNLLGSFMLVKVRKMKWSLIISGLALLVPQFGAAPASAQKPGTPGFQVETRQQREKRLAWQKRRAEIRAERKREKCVANPERRGCDKILATPPAQAGSTNPNPL